MTHHFSIDPRSILGVGLEASMEEIQCAFRDKSKKHHPDLGGDEWAFRMVMRAYEILKTTKETEARHEFPSTVADSSGSETHWRYGKANRNRTMFASGENVDLFTVSEDSIAGGPTRGFTFANQSRASKSPPTVVEFRTIDVELVWIRFELASDLKKRLHEEPAATTLSVCMVISWPRTSLVKHAPEFPDAAEKLRLVIETFEDLRGQEQVLGARSRIEDGQFVGWLSYPNVIQAEAGFQRLQETLSAHDLRISLRTRDEPLPIEWIER
jgi:DnaJ domain